MMGDDKISTPSTLGRIKGVLDQVIDELNKKFFYYRYSEVQVPLYLFDITVVAFHDAMVVVGV